MTSPSDAQPPAAPAENGGGANGDGLAGRYYGRSIPYLPLEGFVAERKGEFQSDQPENGQPIETAERRFRDWRSRLAG